MKRSLPREVLLHGALIASALVVLGPFVWIALAGFKTQISLMMGELAFTPDRFDGARHAATTR